MEYITNANDGFHHEFLSDMSEISEISEKLKRRNGTIEGTSV